MALRSVRIQSDRQADHLIARLEVDTQLAYCPGRRGRPGEHIRAAFEDTKGHPSNVSVAYQHGRCGSPAGSPIDHRNGLTVSILNIDATWTSSGQQIVVLRLCWRSR